MQNQPSVPLLKLCYVSDDVGASGIRWQREKASVVYEICVMMATIVMVESFGGCKMEKMKIEEEDEDA
ncbi:hypothetical protein QVD17_11988 [Tagetes erecta]|uniref:Uncharacterized protein n=1 Tax=Tagetes erecta TaxID=13708 RepID=A0AAD8KUF4_TARER|nr:hypothetical protein QVD17_11988 [Tagetes erecta]